ncbi:MAG: hypothetical protein ABJ084_14045 [Halioglobus sp.]
MSTTSVFFHLRRKLIAVIGSCTILLSIDAAQSETGGDLGSRSVGNSAIFISIVQPARFFAPASFSEGPAGGRSRSANADSAAPKKLLSTGEKLLAPNEFYLDDPAAQYSLTRQLSTTGSAGFLLCVPKDQGDVTLLSSNQKTAVYTASTETGVHSVSVNLTEGKKSQSAGSNAGCPDGGETVVQISITSSTIERLGARPSDNKKVIDKTDRLAKIELVIVPE